MKKNVQLGSLYWPNVKVFAVVVQFELQAVFEHVGVYSR